VSIEVDKGRDELSALWDHTHRHGDKISNLEKIAARLETGQDSLEDKIDTGFSSLKSDLHRSTKPPVNLIGVATLAVILLGSFGTVISYISSQTATSMKRETDLSSDATHIAIDAIKADVSTIVFKMAEDDRREQQDQYDKGYSRAMFDSLEKNFVHLDAELHIRDRRMNDVIMGMRGELSVLEERTMWNVE